MSVIWKFKLALVDEQVIKAPGILKPLSVQMQNGEMTMWAIVTPGQKEYHRIVHVVGTGNSMPDSATHPHTAFVGTVQDDNGFVWHVFIGL